MVEDGVFEVHRNLAAEADFEEVSKDELLTEFQTVEAIIKKLPHDIKKEFIKMKAEKDGQTNPIIEMQGGLSESLWLLTNSSGEKY